MTVLQQWLTMSCINNVLPFYNMHGHVKNLQNWQCNIHVTVKIIICHGLNNLQLPWFLLRYCSYFSTSFTKKQREIPRATLDFIFNKYI